MTSRPFLRCTGEFNRDKERFSRRLAVHFVPGTMAGRESSGPLAAENAAR